MRMTNYLCNRSECIGLQTVHHSTCSTTQCINQKSVFSSSMFFLVYPFSPHFRLDLLSFPSFFLSSLSSLHPFLSSSFSPSTSCAHTTKITMATQRNVHKPLLFEIAWEVANKGNS